VSLLNLLVLFFGRLRKFEKETTYEQEAQYTFLLVPKHPSGLKKNYFL